MMKQKMMTSYSQNQFMKYQEKKKEEYNILNMCEIIRTLHEQNAQQTTVQNIMTRKTQHNDILKKKMNLQMMKNIINTLTRTYQTEQECVLDSDVQKSDQKSAQQSNTER